MTEHRSIDSELIEALTAAGDPYLSCDDCFEQTDVAVESLLATDGHLDDPFRVHLLRCPACHDEAVSLAELIGPELGLTPTEATARLDAELVREEAP